MLKNQIPLFLFAILAITGIYALSPELGMTIAVLSLVILLINRSKYFATW